MNTRRTAVYIAGAYSADNVLGVLDNMRIGMRYANDIWRLGYAPFCPWFDYHLQLMNPDYVKTTVSDYYEYSITWLFLSDVMFVVPNHLKSVGTEKEITVATNNKIPIVYYSIEKLLNDFKTTVAI